MNVTGYLRFTMAGAAFSEWFTTVTGRETNGVSWPKTWEDLVAKQSIVPLQSDQVKLAGTGCTGRGGHQGCVCWCRFTHPTADTSTINPSDI